MSNQAQKSNTPLFGKENYLLMLIGGIIILIGFFLMSGGKNVNPNTFEVNAVYAKTRITVAPLLILAGLVLEIYAIFKRSK